MGTVRHLKRRPGRPKVDIDVREMIRLYVDEKMSIREVADQLGVSHATVARRLIQSDVQLRGWRMPGEL